MKVVVTGSVEWTDPGPIYQALDELRELHGQVVVLTGMAEGADEFARSWAQQHDMDLIVEPLWPGDYPGPMHRYNEWLLGNGPNLVLAFKAGFDAVNRPSAGTEHMVLIARAAEIEVRVHRGNE